VLPHAVDRGAGRGVRLPVGLVVAYRCDRFGDGAFHQAHAHGRAEDGDQISTRP